MGVTSKLKGIPSAKGFLVSRKQGRAGEGLGVRPPVRENGGPKSLRKVKELRFRKDRSRVFSGGIACT